MGYEQVNQSEETLLAQHDEQHTSKKWQTTPSWRRNKTPWLVTGLNIILLLTSVTLFLRNKSCSSTSPQNSWIRETSNYSPLWSTSVESQLKKHPQKLSGSLFPLPSSSIYRDTAEPSEERNKAWKDLEWVRTFPMTREDIIKIGKDPQTAVKFPPEYGFGDDAYAGHLDIFHQLHCLNFLRTQAWEAYDRDGTTAKPPYPETHWLHLGHCTEVLRENLICNANLDVITFNWKETQDKPYPDFDLNKKCTDLDVLVAWQEQNTLPVETSVNFTRPHGAKQIPMEDEYFQMFGLRKVDLNSHQDMHGPSHEEVPKHGHEHGN